MPRATAQLLAPVGDPEKVICVGLNYHDHCQEQGAKVPKEPLIFSKFPSAITGPFDDIVHPQDTSVGTPGPTPTAPWGNGPPSPHSVPQELDWEVELAAIIGERGRHIEVPPCPAPASLQGSVGVSPRKRVPAVPRRRRRWSTCWGSRWPTT